MKILVLYSLFSLYDPLHFLFIFTERFTSFGRPVCHAVRELRSILLKQLKDYISYYKSGEEDDVRNDDLLLLLSALRFVF